ncbi:NDMA-dependent alcohol dehydrogenase [Amycolatopsis sp. GM8]|uniref:NDMA-dependent alcohol dehydrogenase n=1 Tax=Amycolatopsis sp. GM8 TaxID=2896530 RepID=UPI001F01157C|nr:NDMA-dependent alcohol dehydrogenase [Amycolatopsis sp. GM8]
MRTRGAVIAEVPGRLEVIDLEVDEPRADELEVKVVASGMCHSDDHHATGDSHVGILPFAMGHEGAGIVTRLGGPNTKGIKEGDHVVFNPLPSCGHCRRCATGHQNLCDLGAGVLVGARWRDPSSYRLHTVDGRPVGQMCGISTFASTTLVSIESVVKIPDDIPLDKACLVGCGVSTGWGSAVTMAEVQPGHTVVVMGTGGVGVNAVQGAVHAGAAHIIGVDPAEFKRQAALEFGATHAVATMDEAAELARQFTNGQGADAVVVTVGVLQPDYVAQALGALGKGGICVVTAVGNEKSVGVPIRMTELTFSQKQLRGTVFGGTNGNWDVLRLLDLYRAGRLKLDELITRTYTLDEIQKGYDDLLSDQLVRGVVLHD